MKKSKIQTSIPQNLMIYHIKKLCHHIEHTLLYMSLKYGAIWTNIASFIDSFLIKLHSGIWSQANFLSWAWKTTRTKTKPRTQQRKKNHKKWKLKFNPRLKTQTCKAKTWYMLEDDSNKTLFS